MKRSLLALTLVFNLLASAAGQNPAPSPRPRATTTAPAQQPQQQQGEETSSDDVVRISANLVQVDAVITDSRGRIVTDLRPEEIEIREDDRPQKITNFSFVPVVPAASEQPRQSAGPADRNAPPAPPSITRPEQVHRTIALVVDDLGISFESMGFVRKGLKKFVDEQMQPGDLVAIIRTSAGMGALQQFTSDKRLLHAAIERIRWNPGGRSGTSAFAPMESNPLTRVDSTATGSGPTPVDETEEQGESGGFERGGGSQNRGANPIGVEDRHIGDDLEDDRQDILTVGTLGAVGYVVRGLSELPGRKSILLITDGMVLFERNPFGHRNNARITEALRRLTDQANRASVVIYAMDSRGLQPLGMTAEDSTTNLSNMQVQQQLINRRQSLIESQEDLEYLPQATGGFTVKNRNDLGAGIKQVVDDQRGYYLIGYRPEESTFDPVTGRRNYHKLTIRVVGRSGLNVRYRTGFFGVSDVAARPELRTRQQQMVNALASPFSANGVNLRLTSLFGNDQRTGSFVRSLLHIDMNNLTFTKEADGWNKAVFDVLAITFGEGGQIVDQISRTHTLRVRGAAYEQIIKNGFDYFINLPVKKAGAYQLRTAVRDTASERVGSATQFIEVPDIAKNRLTLSGIVMSGTEQAAARGRVGSAQPGVLPSAASNASPEGESRVDDSTSQFDPQAGPAVRRFRQGMLMHYSFLIYNAQLDRSTGAPQLQTQVRLFRDGQQVFAGRPRPFDARGQADLKRLLAGGVLRLGNDLTPGEYVLQVIVTDPLAKDKKYRTTTQWIDFEIVK